LFDIGAICTDYEVIPDDKAFRIKICHCGETSVLDFSNKENKIETPCGLHPTVYIKNVKTRKYLMYFECNNYGPIVDTITVGNAMLGNGASSLDNMLERYGFKNEKKNTVDYEVYNYDMHVYASKDVLLTCKLLLAEYQLFKRHQLDKPFYSFMSEASVGKAYEDKFGIPPFKQAHKEIPAFMYGLANMNYAGGLNETNIRKIIKLICYCDFKSQYPLVNALLDTQSMYLSKYIRIVRNSDVVQKIVDTVTPDIMLQPDNWKNLFIIVKIQCDGDMLPHKGIDNGVQSFGIKRITNGERWCSILDAIASKFYTDKPPTIIDSYMMVASSERIQTNIVSLFGDNRYQIDLSKSDLYASLIDVRDDVKSDLKVAQKEHSEESHQHAHFLSNLQNAIKLIANSSSYGIRVETRERKLVDGSVLDIAGKYNAQPIGIHITAGGRLLLAMANFFGRQYGISHAACDTDSFMYAKPDDMEKDTFYHICRDVIVPKFNTLSPYKNKQAPVFELEDVNKWDGDYKDLYIYAVSTKRYCLFNIVDNKPVIRKFTEHGLPNFTIDRSIALPNDVLPPLKANWRKERYVMWYRGIEQALNDKDASVSDNDDVLAYPALSQVTVSTPHMYRQFKHLNVRPFCFFLRTPKNLTNKKVVPVYLPLVDSLEQLNRFIQRGLCRTLASDEINYQPQFETVGTRYHNFFNHSEMKFINGDSKGLMKRKEVDASTVEIRTRTGKKTNNVTQMTLF
jgi:hypothetical protein